MKTLGLTVMALLAFPVVAFEAVRNPFWPEGFKGELVPISAEPRVKPKPKAPEPKAPVAPKVTPKPKLTPAEVAAAAKAKAAQEAAAAKAVAELAAKAAKEAELKRVIVAEDWIKARRSLKISNPAKFKMDDGTTRMAIAINGNIYANEDLVSVNHANIRFTWRVKGLDGKESLKLVRIKARRIDTEATKKSGGK